MTIEYTDSINYFDWPKVTESGLNVDWTLDEKDEDQLEANCDGLDSTIKYLEQKVKERGLKKDPTQKNR